MMKSQYDYKRFLTKLQNSNKEGVLYALAYGERVMEEDTPVFSYAIQRPDGWKTDWSVLSGWSDFWNAIPKAKDGHPLYTLRFANAICGNFGKQRVPTHADVWRAEDGLALLGLEKEWKTYRAQHQKILSDCPQLSDWHTKYFSRIQKEDMYPACLSIAKAFMEGKGKNQYMREIAAIGVDTKFIERHGFLIRTLWNALFPNLEVQNTEELAARLSWKAETVGNVYVRFLDSRYSFYGTRQCFMSAENLADFHPPVKRVFIVENKVNGYTFPDVPDSLILAGAGYGILDVARKAEWLQDRNVYYWGDMDSDGFYILGKLRSTLPYVSSFLMDIGTAAALADQAVRDDGEQGAVSEGLTLGEKMLWRQLRDQNARIEQERIPLSMVKRAVADLESWEESEWEYRMNLDLEIRKGTMADLDAVAAVESECFPAAEAATKDSFQARLAHYPSHFLLAFHGEKLVGFIDGMVTNEKDLTDAMYDHAEMHDENGAWQMIFGLNTIPRERRQGIAGRLIRAFQDMARKEGRKGIVLTCKEKLVHYYAEFGFVDEGISGSTHGGVVWHQMRWRM